MVLSVINHYVSSYVGEGDDLLKCTDLTDPEKCLEAEIAKLKSI